MKQPTPSNILITLIEGDSRLWPGLEIESIIWTGDSAEFENEAGMLEEELEEFAPTEPGTYFIYGFTAYYTKDYYGEVDAECSIEGWRKATEEDIASFGGRDAP